MAHTVLRFLLAVLFAGSAVAGFEQALDRRLFGEAIAVGQSRIEAVRTRFHQPYRIQVSRPPIDYIDIVTPFRRVALLAEERAQAGGRLFQRDAIALLGDRSTLVEILVEMTFHPLNVFVGVPAYNVELATAASAARINPLEIGRIPRFGARLEGVPLPSRFARAPSLPGESQPMLGGTIVATFGAGALNPNGVYEVVVSDKGKELARARVNLGTLRQERPPGPRLVKVSGTKPRSGGRALRPVPAYESTLTTTRRFWARPSRVSFAPAGLSSP